MIGLFRRACYYNGDGTYNGGSSVGSSIKQLVKLLQSICGTSVKIIEIEEKRTILVLLNVLNVSEIAEKFGWRPNTIRCQASLA